MMADAVLQSFLIDRRMGSRMGQVCKAILVLLKQSSMAGFFPVDQNLRVVTQHRGRFSIEYPGIAVGYST